MPVSSVASAVTLTMPLTCAPLVGNLSRSQQQCPRFLALKRDISAINSTIRAHQERHYEDVIGRLGIQLDYVLIERDTLYRVRASARNGKELLIILPPNHDLSTELDELERKANDFLNKTDGILKSISDLDQSPHFANNLESRPLSMLLTMTSPVFSRKR